MNPTSLRLSAHQVKHYSETWNQVTIRKAFLQHEVRDIHEFEGQTADVICGKAPDGEYVGLIVSKERDGMRIIITGFAAPLEYWRNV